MHLFKKANLRLAYEMSDYQETLEGHPQCFETRSGGSFPVYSLDQLVSVYNSLESQLKKTQEKIGKSDIRLHLVGRIKMHHVDQTFNSLNEFQNFLVANHVLDVRSEFQPIRRL